jgi:bifunctional non-homologous end joining protein LigD
MAKEQFAALSARKIAKSTVATPRIPNAVFTEPAAIARIAFNSRAADGAPRQPVLIGIAPYRTSEPAIKPKLVTDRDLAAIRLTNPDRAMFGSDGANKLDIAVYYARVGDWMLPELLRRPVSLIRCPSGEQEDCFYQRHAFHGLPPGVATIPIREEESRADFIYVETAQGFLSLTQFGVVEFHPWGCRADNPESPDRLVVDLDPDPELPWPQLKAAAELLRGRLTDLGLTPFLRTTGGKGLHLVVAVKRCDWPTLRGFAEGFARSAAADAPQFFTSTSVKERRKGRIYIDWLRNARGSSAIASYSLRANPGFTVAAPIGWEELRTLASPRAFDRVSMIKRLSHLAKDPWEDIEASAAPISARAKRAVGTKA